MSLRKTTEVLFYSGLLLGSFAFMPEYFYDGFETPKLFCVQVSVALIAILFLFSFIKGISLEAPLEIFFLAGLFIIGTVSILWSANQFLALERLFHISTLVVWLVFAWALFKEKSVKGAFYFVAFIGGAIAVWALMLDWIIPLRNWIYPHFLEINAAGTRIVDHYRTLISSQGNPNFTLHILVLTAPLTLGLILHEFFNRGRLSISLSFAFLAQFVCFLKTDNRSGILSVAVALVLILSVVLFNNGEFIKTRWKKPSFIMVGLCFLIGFLVWFGTRIDRFKTLGNLNNIDVYSRVVFLETGTAMIADNPLLGKGIGQFVIHYPKYKTKKHWEVFKSLAPEIRKWEEIPKQAHNEYLQVFIELGVVGFLIFVSFWIFFFIKVLKDLKPLNYLVLGAFAGVVGFLINSLFTFPMQTVTSGILFWTVCGLLLASCKGWGLKIKISILHWIVLLFSAGLLWGSLKTVQAKYIFFDAVKQHAFEPQYSLKRIRKATEMLPYSFEMQYVAGWIALLNNKGDMAAKHYEHSLENAPYFPAPHPYLINYYYSKRDRDKVIDALRRYREAYAPVRKMQNAQKTQG